MGAPAMDFHVPARASAVGRPPFLSRLVVARLATAVSADREPNDPVPKLRRLHTR